MPARYAVPQPTVVAFRSSRIVRPPAAPVAGTITPSGLDRTSTRALGTLTVTNTLPLPLTVALQGASNSGLVTRQVPSFGRQQPKDPNPGVFVYVYSAPPIFNVIVPGGTNQGYKFQAPPTAPIAVKQLASRLNKLRQTAVSISPTGLDRTGTRALGTPLVNPKLGPAGLTHSTRALGSPSTSQGAKRALGQGLTVTVTWVPRPASLDHTTRTLGDPTARGKQTVTTDGLLHARAQGTPTLSGRALPASITHTRTLGTVEVNLITLAPTALDRVT